MSAVPWTYGPVDVELSNIWGDHIVNLSGGCKMGRMAQKRLDNAVARFLT